MLELGNFCGKMAYGYASPFSKRVLGKAETGSGSLLRASCIFARLSTISLELQSTPS